MERYIPQQEFVRPPVMSISDEVVSMPPIGPITIFEFKNPFGRRPDNSGSAQQSPPRPMSKDQFWRIKSDMQRPHPSGKRKGTR